MNLRRLSMLAAALIAAASFSGATAQAATAAHAGPASAPVRPFTFIGTDEGYGATLAAAELDAKQQLRADYYGCQTPFITSYGQFADGSWWADSEANGCQGYN
jgi:hypothetical protein